MILREYYLYGDYVHLRKKLLESHNALLQKKCIIRVLRDIGIILIFSIYVL